jgi:hypothetical protein
MWSYQDVAILDFLRQRCRLDSKFAQKKPQRKVNKEQKIISKLIPLCEIRILKAKFIQKHILEVLTQLLIAK